MARRSDYAERLRDASLMLALVPLSGLGTANYWLRESLDRTSTFAASIIAGTSLARAARSTGAAGRPDAAADVLAQDLLDSARTYVQSMIGLPRDAAIYFTGEVERQLEGLNLRPDPTTNLEGYADRELERVLSELDRLAVVTRAEAARAPRAGAARGRRLLDELEQLRAGARRVREGLKPVRPRPGLVATSAVWTLDQARARLESACKEAVSLLPRRRRVPRTLHGMARSLEMLAREALRSGALRRQRNGKKGSQAKKS